MHASAMITVTAAAAAGVTAAAIARALRIPAIVPLLLTGAALGPAGLDVVRPDSLGNGVRLMVELVVAVILFEGSITLSVEGLRGHGRRVSRLLTLGALVTWAGAAASAHLLLDLSWPIAVMVGAILIVTGPTVVVPILAHVRPRADLASILRWEGILIDAVGALAAVVTLEVLLEGTSAGFGQAALRYASTAGVGIGVGLVAGLLLSLLLSRALTRQGSDSAPLVLGACFAAFAGAEALRQDAGLFATTVAGLVLALSRPHGLKAAEHYLSGMVSFVLPWIFVLLAASIVPGDLVAWGWQGAAFLAGLVLTRALAVNLSCGGMPGRERAFLTVMAPRGVVAVMVASFSAAALAEHGVPGAHHVFDVVVLVVFATVVGVGALARPLGHMLGVLSERPRTVLIVGASRFGRSLAETFASQGVPCLLIDKNAGRLEGPEIPGLRRVCADALDEGEMTSLELGEVVWALAATPNDEANALITGALQRWAPQAVVTQLPTRDWALRQAGRHEAVRGTFAFGDRLTLEVLELALAQGKGLRVVEAPWPATDAQGLRAHLGAGLRPLLVLREKGPPIAIQTRNAPLPGGVRLICADAPPLASAEA